MHGIHLINLTHVVHLMHGTHLINLVHGIHAVAPGVRRRSPLWHVALLRDAVASVHAPRWAHVHLLVGVVHRHGLRPYTCSLVGSITILLPKMESIKLITEYETKQDSYQILESI